MTGARSLIAGMSAPGPNWVAVGTIFAAIVVMVMALLLLVSRRKLSLISVAVGVIVSIGLSLGVYALCQRSVHRYLSSAARQAESYGHNISQVRAIMGRCSETRIPSTSVLARDLGICDPSITLYKYGFYDVLNKGNCILVMYNARGGTELLIPMFDY